MRNAMLDLIGMQGAADAALFLLPDSLATSLIGRRNQKHAGFNVH